MASKFEDVLEAAGAGEVADAILSGLVDLNYTDEPDIESQLAYFFKSVGDAVTSGTTYPLFDDDVASVVDAAVKEGIIIPGASKIQLGKVAGLAADLFQRLPTFERASIKEVLSIRQELAGPLVRFRGAITAFAKEIETAQWDSSFGAEAELLFRQRVGPAIEDLEDRVQSSSLRYFLVETTFGKDIMVPATTSLLGMGVGALGGLSEAVSVAAGLAVGAGRAVLEAKGKADYAAAQIKANNLYFYYKARYLF